MPRLLLFAGAADAAGTRSDIFETTVLGDLLMEARARYGSEFAAVLDNSRVWVNGDEPVDGTATRLAPDDEVAVLPPVSGGSIDLRDRG